MKPIFKLNDGDKVRLSKFINLMKETKTTGLEYYIDRTDEDSARVKISTEENLILVKVITYKNDIDFDWEISDNYSYNKNLIFVDTTEQPV